MAKTAFIFPGQGAQYVGMAKDFYDTYPECKEIIDKADELMDFDLKKILFEENDLINKLCLKLSEIEGLQCYLFTDKQIIVVC